MLNVVADLRNQLEPARDQGRRPTCLSFAASATHRAAHKHPTQLSPEWLYYHATRRDGLQPDQGSTIEATCTAILNDGQPDEEFWPYQDREVCLNPYQPAGQRPVVVRCDTGQRSSDSDRWRSEIDSGSPVVITLFISSAFYQPARFIGPEALMAEDHIPIDPTLAHAVVLAGYGYVNGASHFLVRNSWGLRWGWAGYAWFSETYLTRRFAGAFVIQHGASDDV
ncbi:cysteine protease [Mesorhizobium australicum WSM2073]|uniref:Cysteine protease n=3 Tax=Mesorhizobium TaxID=68287 RepID=L0KUV4_MESAW|nr:MULTISPECIES: C1 family peptidase [Mesorhizobium]ADV14588.1 peptidase C1A papain [Mesorhizobium ciceri biovar biserrulae WSM1271]AGB47843.1 cysteine protease [Mesorhizobium australicum WSM2073]OBP90048.1 peptidase C1 [Mesorhizobium loti]